MASPMSWAIAEHPDKKKLGELFLILQKIGSYTTRHILGRKENTCPHTSLQTNVQISIAYNNQGAQICVFIN